MCSLLPICKYLTDVPVWRRLGRQTHKAPSFFRSCGNRIHTRVSWSSSPYIWQLATGLISVRRARDKLSTTAQVFTNSLHHSAGQAAVDVCKCPKIHIILYGQHGTHRESQYSDWLEPSLNFEHVIMILMTLLTLCTDISWVFFCRNVRACFP